MKKSVRNILLAATALATIAVGINMYSLWQQETLWGHRPLFFFVLAWATVVLASWKRYNRHPKGMRWLGLSTLSAVLLTLSFPPFPLTKLLFFAWIPLLIVEYEVAMERKAILESSNPQILKPSILPYTYYTFVLWNILVTWWVGNTAFIAGIVAIWINAWFMYVPFWFFHKTRQYLPKAGYLSLIVFWISFEYLHLNWELSWSWLNLGNAFAKWPEIVQWYEYTGIFGGSLWALVANVLIFKLLEADRFHIDLKNIWQTQRRKLLIIKVVVFVPMLVSLLMYFNEKDEGRNVEVAVVQPNFEPHYQKFNIPVREQMERFLRLSDSILTEKTEYLVWPETSFNAGRMDDIATNSVVRNLQLFLEKHPKVKLVAGVDAYKVYKDGEPHTAHTRREERGSQTFYWEAYNAAIQLQAGADSIPFYIKSKLVPGAEILPYNKYLFFLSPIADKLGGSVEGLGSQTEREAFPSESGKVAPSICYESIFGEYNGGYVRAGAEATFIMTNDGWWDNTGGHKQHLAFARLRAIETRRSIARSANTGISCFINQRGDIQQPTKYGEEAAIRQDIQFNDRLTFYVRFGDVIAKMAAVVTLVLLVGLVVVRFRKKE